jgi:hypothetical protein
MSTAQILTKRFCEMGARVQIRSEPPPRRSFLDNSPLPSTPKLDVRRDEHGEYFDICFTTGVEQPDELAVLDVRPSDRHLLLLSKNPDTGNKSKFLCGHDERHWFVAAIPEQARSVSSVKTAKEALQPDAVRAALDRQRIRPKDRLKRHNKAFHRQGEWFFIPIPNLKVDRIQVVRNEPLSRGRGSKPHNMEFACRRGGVTVYVNFRFPNGITQEEYDQLPPNERRRRNWRVRVRDAEVYAKGRISHADHATITLEGWHRVEMNTEREAEAMRHVVFLD